VLEGLGDGLKVGVQRWDELGIERNAKRNHSSRNSRLGETELVFFLFCSLMFGSCCLLRCMNTSKC